MLIQYCCFLVELYKKCKIKKSLYLVIIDNVIFKSHSFVMENAMNVIEMYLHILHYIKLVLSLFICLMFSVNIGLKK